MPRSAILPWVKGIVAHQGGQKIIHSMAEVSRHPDRIYPLVPERLLPIRTGYTTIEQNNPEMIWVFPNTTDAVNKVISQMGIPPHEEPLFFMEVMMQQHIVSLPFLPDTISIKEKGESRTLHIHHAPRIPEEIRRLNNFFQWTPDKGLASLAIPPQPKPTGDHQFIPTRLRNY